MSTDREVAAPSAAPGDEAGGRTLDVGAAGLSVLTAMCAIWLWLGAPLPEQGAVGTVVGAVTTVLGVGLVVVALRRTR